MILRKPENCKQVEKKELLNVWLLIDSTLILYRRIHFPFFHAAAWRWHIGHREIVDTLRIPLADATTNLYPKENLTIITFDRVIVIWFMSGRGMISDKTRKMESKTWLWTQNLKKTYNESSDSKSSIQREGEKHNFEIEESFSSTGHFSQITNDAWKWLIRWKSFWIPSELTDKITWISTWNATKATRIQLNQCGSSALLNEMAKKMVTTAKKTKKIK